MPTKKSDERVNIQGPSGDVLEVTRGDFEKSHYAEQGYEIAGPAPADDPDAPKDADVLRSQIVAGIKKLEQSE